MERIKSFFPVMVSLVAALLSLTLIYRYINQMKASIFEGMELQRVFVFKYDVEQGSLIDPDIFEIKEIPVRFLDSTVITESQIRDLQGRRVAISAKKGEILRSIHIDSNESNNLSRTLPSDYRAVTIEIDDINSLSHSVKPGDRVDIFVTFSDPASGETKTMLLFQNIEIISTGLKRKDEVKNSETDESDGIYSNITLLMKPEDAAMLVFFRENGKLSIVLRNPSDRKEIRNINEITYKSLYFKDKRKNHNVEVILGANIRE